MAFRVLTDDPSAREVGDLIIVHDRFSYVDVLGLLDQNYVEMVEDAKRVEPAMRSNQGEEGDNDEDGDDEEDDEADEEVEDDDTDSERS